MKLKQEDHGQAVVLSIQGELTTDHTSRFENAAREALATEARDVVVDLTESSFLDSKALESLLWLQDQCAEKLGQVRLVGLNDDLQTVLRLTRLVSRFEQHGSTEQALESLRL